MIEYISKADQTNPTSNQGTATTTTVVNLPTGAQDGDYLLAFVVKDTDAVHTITPPAGWTLITSQESTSLGLYAYHKFALSEGSTYSWSVSGSARSWSVGIHCYRGVSTTNPIDSSAVSTSATTTTADVAWPSITTVGDGCQIVAARAVTKSTGPTGTGMNSSDGTGDLVKRASYGVFDAVGQTDLQRYMGSFTTWTSTGGVASAGTSLLATANSYMAPGAHSAWNSNVTMTVNASNCLMVIGLRPAPPGLITYRPTFYRVEHVGTQARYGTSSTSGNATVTRPDGLLAGDYMIAMLITNNDTITPPSGWTQLYTDASPSGAAWRTLHYGKFALTADVSTANYSWNVANTTAAPSVIILSAFRNVDPLNPTNVSAVNTGTTVGTANAADVTTTVPCAVLHYVATRRSTGTPANHSTTGTGYCEMADVTNVGTVGYAGGLYWHGENLGPGLCSGPSIVSGDATNQTDYTRRTIALAAQVAAPTHNPNLAVQYRAASI